MVVAVVIGEDLAEGLCFDQDLDDRVEEAGVAEVLESWCVDFDLAVFVTLPFPGMCEQNLYIFDFGQYLWLVIQDV